MTLTLLLALLLFLNVYWSWSNNKPDGLISLQGYFAETRQKGRFWEILQAVTVPLIFAYNQLVLIAATGRLVLQAGIWLFQNLVVDGLWWLLRVLFHYIIAWPWRLLLLAFHQIRTSWSMSSYRTGAIGLSMTLCLIFLGLYLKGAWNAPDYVSYLFTLLSIFPLSAALSKIAWSKAKNGKESTFGRFFLRFLQFTGLALALLAVQAGLVYLGSMGKSASILSSLFAGGNILLSLFLIVDCIILFFMLSVLPQHLLYEEDGFIPTAKSTLKHLFHKWPQYLLGTVLVLIPAALLTLIPTILISGAIHITDYFSKEMFDSRIEQLNAEIRTDLNADQFESWVTSETMTKDSLMENLAALRLNREKMLDKIDLEVSRDFIAGRLGKYGMWLGAAPVYGVGAEAIVYQGLGQAAVDITPPLTASQEADQLNSIHTTEANDRSVLGKIEGSLNNALNSLNNRKKSLELTYKYQCTKLQDPSPSAPPDQKTGTVSSDPSPYDPCAALRKQIDEVETMIGSVQSKQERTSIIQQELSDIQQAGIAHMEAQKSIYRFAYLVLGLLLCLIFGLALGFLIPVLGHMNYAIYHLDRDDETWYVTQLYREANSRNPNQPLLGLLLSPLTFVVLISLAGSITSLETPVEKMKLRMERVLKLATGDWKATSMEKYAVSADTELSGQEYGESEAATEDGIPEIIENTNPFPETAALDSTSSFVDSETPSEVAPTDSESTYFKILDPSGAADLKDAPYGNILRKVADTELFEVINKQNNFYEVRFSDGTTGFIHILYVVPAK